MDTAFLASSCPMTVLLISSKSCGLNVLDIGLNPLFGISTCCKPTKLFNPLIKSIDAINVLVGKVADQKGNLYYKVKNSWGTQSGKDGFLYISIPYVRLKAISVMLHKDGLIKKTKSALGV
jgi:hypothetical protein